MSKVYRPGTLERSVIGASKKAQWIRDTDDPTLWLARFSVRRIDVSKRQLTLDGIDPMPDREFTELCGLTRRLLGDLGFSPRARQQLGLEEVHDQLAAVIDYAEAAARNTAEQPAN